MCFMRNIFGSVLQHQGSLWYPPCAAPPWRSWAGVGRAPPWLLGHQNSLAVISRREGALWGCSAVWVQTGWAPETGIQNARYENLFIPSFFPQFYGVYCLVSVVKRKFGLSLIFSFFQTFGITMMGQLLHVFSRFLHWADFQARLRHHFHLSDGELLLVIKKYFLFLPAVLYWWNIYYSLDSILFIPPKNHKNHPTKKCPKNQVGTWGISEIYFKVWDPVWRLLDSEYLY